MCGTCGCSDPSNVTIDDGRGVHTHILADGTEVTHSHERGGSQHHAHEHGGSQHHAHEHGGSQHHGHEHGGSQHHAHEHGGSQPHTHHSDRSIAPAHDTTLITLEQRVLAKNERLAERNRAFFLGRKLSVVNLMSSPGSGKTCLLERTLTELRPHVDVAVLEGDQETSNDAARLRQTGAPVVQINTGTGCHLEADMVWRGLSQLDPPAGSTLFIENVGNLVCPALFDLGEHARVVLFSVTEGEDKPVKYPHMFRRADLVLLTKTDLLPYLEFDLDRAHSSITEVAPDAEVLQLSTKSGEGVDAWVQWLKRLSRETVGR